MATKYLSKTFSYGLLLQTNWATPQAAGANYKTIPYNAGVTIFEPDVRVEGFNTSSQNGIHKEIERVYIDGRSGLPKVNFSMPADLTTLAPHLRGLLVTAWIAVGRAHPAKIASSNVTWSGILII